MPFGPYADMKDCIAKNQDKNSPAGFCAWLHKNITGTYPSQLEAPMPTEAWDIFMAKYAPALDAGKSEAEAFTAAVKEGLEPAGWVETRSGWERMLQAPKLKQVAGVKVFASGTHTDSAGVTKEWTEADLDRMVEAFVAGVPQVCALKAGHTPDAFNTKIAEALDVPVDVVTGLEGQGQIALGRMSSLERKGNLLIASFERVPEAIANLIEGGLYSTVSVEIEDEVGAFGPVITAVALLGAEEPAVAQATLDRAAVFGAVRDGTRVFSLAVGKDFQTEELRREFADIKERFTDIIKGKKGAPIFRALFAKLSEMFEQLAGSGRHQSGVDDASVPEEVVALAAAEYQGNVQALINWAGQVGFDQCVASLTGKPGITDPVKVCGYLKGRAHSNSAQKEGHGMKLSELKAKFQEPGMPPEGAEAANTLAAIATALGLSEDATLEEIIAVLQAMAGQAAQAQAPAEGEMKTEFSKMSATIKQQGDTIARLEHEARVERFQKVTSTFQAVEGKPEDLASELADLEEKAGPEVAQKALAAYQAAEKAGAAALHAVGTAKPGAKATAFEDKVQEFQKADPKLSRADAIKMAMRANPDLYREVRDQFAE